MGHKIRIVTETEGGKTVADFSGNAIRGPNGLCVVYAQEGDKTELLFSQDALRMRRFGEVTLSALFRLGVETSMETAFAGGRAQIPLKTTLYTFSETPAGCFSTLEYLLFSDSKPIPFHLEIFIKEA